MTPTTTTTTTTITTTFFLSLRYKGLSYKINVYMTLIATKTIE